MTTQSRQGGSRRKRGAALLAAAPLASEPFDTDIVAPVAALTADDAELADDRSAAIAGGAHGTSLRRSLPVAVVGLLFVAGIAFGAAGPGGLFASRNDSANLGNPRLGAVGSDESGRSGVAMAALDGDGYPALNGDIEGSTGGDLKTRDGTAVDDSDGDGAGQPKDDENAAPDPTKKPESKPEPKAEPKPEPARDEHISIALALKYDHPVIEWGSCAGLDFDYYKVVRSKDSTVSWPTGSNDTLIAVDGPDGDRRAWDKDAPHGAKAWYRVFCVRKTDDGYRVLNSSAAKGIFVPEGTPPPDPISLALDANATGDGKVSLDWGACEVDGFAFYKVVMSTSNDNPSYMPWTDGTDVVGVVENMHDTELLTAAPESGETAYYRVQCLGFVGGQKVVLGQSGVVSVTTP